MVDLSNISLQFGGKYLFQNVNFRINSGDKISLVGANGSGKSSLLKMINGDLQPESGLINKQKNISIGYLPQENIIHKNKTLIYEALSALTNIIGLREKEIELTYNLNKEMPDEEKIDLVNQLGEVHYKLDELGSYAADSKVKKILMGLGFNQEDFEKQTDEFSGGLQMRIALAKILISQNDLILLDEPTNHLDIDSLEWLINFLKNYHGALLVVSHDKYFINEVTNKTLEIYLNKFYRYNGNYDAYLKYKEERDTLTETQFIQQQKKIKDTEKFIERFRYKATKAKQVQSRIKQLGKINLIELPENKSDINIKFPEPPASGKVNLTLSSVSKSYGKKVVFENITFQVNRGEKIAFVGPNGAGKTTLAKIIAGEIGFDSGERRTGHNTFISFYAQDVADNLNPDIDILETMENISEEKTIGQLRSLLGSFLFTGDDVFKKISVLSGGEKSRVALAKILLTKSNLIILDEPTNHLDISSKEVLLSALKEFSGSLVLVSHDISFLKPLVNKIVEIRKGEIKEYAGGIEYYLEKRQEYLNGQDLVQKVSKNEQQKELNRKEKKRTEAELRQKKYDATREINEKIKKLESKIELLEKEEEELKNLLADPVLYNSHETAKEKTARYNNLQIELDEYLKEWEALSEKLHEIEQQFS
jgi:ATP-binding cassette subfamily F protein 3